MGASENIALRKLLPTHVKYENLTYLGTVDETKVNRRKTDRKESNIKRKIGKIEKSCLEFGVTYIRSCG